MDGMKVSIVKHRVSEKRYYVTSSISQHASMAEVRILDCLDHPCLPKLYDVFVDDSNYIHLVKSLCAGGFVC